VWLPKQAPELNAMDQLWRGLKAAIAANRQAPSIAALASMAMLWVLMLSRDGSPSQSRHDVATLLAR